MLLNASFDNSSSVTIAVTLDTVYWLIFCDLPIIVYLYYKNDFSKFVLDCQCTRAISKKIKLNTRTNLEGYVISYQVYIISRFLTFVEYSFMLLI